MGEWGIQDGQLTIARARGHEMPSADDVYRSVIEGERRWADVEPGRTGAAAQLSFSRYPATVQILLKASNGTPHVSFEAVLPAGKGRIEVTASQIRIGHLIANSAWYPLDPDSMTAVLVHSRDAGIPEGGELRSLRGVLRIKQIRNSGLLDDQLEMTAGDASRLAPAAPDVPTGIHATLYPYQTVGWRWLRFVAAEEIGGILADEMGLGKTLQVISLIRDPGAGTPAPALIVAPGSLLENWYRELKKFAPTLSVLKHHGALRTGSPAGLNGYDVIVTSYETVVRDSAIMELRQWGLVVLDEAQNIRNPNATRARAVKRLKRRAGVAVTGTPLENRLTDVWSILDFTCPGYLGSEQDFTSHFVEMPNGARLLEPLISPLILRRRVVEVARDLPERIDVPQILEMDSTAAEQYEGLRQAINEEYGRAASLVALTKLRMFAAHPQLALQNLEGTDFIKLQRLDELAEEIFAAGEKILVFTSYTEMADIISDRLAANFNVFAATLDGRCPINDRQPLIDKFSEVIGGAVLVLNPRAGGAGLNITAANHVVHYNPEWNPALEDQASARVHRRGQIRPVTIHRLLLSGTVEEVIADRLQRKRALQGETIVGVEGEDEDLADIAAALGRSPVSRKLNA